jgi:dipeptidyl aminopeptidase/acylaminoacyl peptidase
MHDLSARFDSLNRVPVPDVWDEVRRRTVALETSAAPRPIVKVPAVPRSRPVQGPLGGSSARRRPAWWLVAATLAAIALLAIGLVAGGSRLLSVVTPSPAALSPAPAVASPSPAVVSPAPGSPAPVQNGGATNGLIAYSSNGRIFVVAPDGSNPRALTPADEDAYQPRWSPDGEHLAFLRLSCVAGQPCDRKAGPISLVVMKPDGSGRQTLAEKLENVMTLEWSPDGKQLAFEAESPFGVRVLTLATHEVRVIGVGEFPNWSPDGTTIAYQGEGQTHLVASDGTADRLLLQPTQAGLAISARWSPDGSQLAFVWKRACCPPTNRASDAWLVDRSGNNPHRWPEVPVGVTFEGWSPDGRSIAYLDASQPNPAFAWPLIVANADGSSPRSVATVGSGWVHWSPDGTQLLVRDPSGNSTRLLIVDLTGATPDVELSADDASWQSIP